MNLDGFYRLGQISSVFNTLFERLLHVSCDEVSAIAKKYLNPDDWSFVMAGRVGEEGKSDKK